MTDPIVNRVCQKFQNRSELGRSKYGTDLTRKDLNQTDWLNHLQEELMDATNYVEALLQNNLVQSFSNFAEQMHLAEQKYRGKDLESEQARLARELLRSL